MDTWTHIKLATSELADLTFPKAERKLFPFHYMTTFREVDDSKAKSKKIPHIHCSYCKDDCAENGNGSYYSGYIVFESNEAIMVACSRHCLPKASMEFQDQVWGYREPIRLPAKFKKSIEHVVVFDAVLSYHEYEFNKYINKGVNLNQLTQMKTEYSGGANGIYRHELRAGKLSITAKGKRSFTLTKVQVLKVVNEILFNQDQAEIKPTINAGKLLSHTWCTTCGNNSDKEISTDDGMITEMLCLKCNNKFVFKNPIKIPPDIIRRSAELYLEREQKEKEQSLRKKGDIAANKKTKKAEAPPAPVIEIKKEKTFFGGKNGNGTYQKIINKIPPHKRYIELFLGSGAILNNKQPAKESYGVEIHSGTIDKFSYNSSAKIITQDVFEFIKTNPQLFDKDTYVYVDPPYPLSSIKSKSKGYVNVLTDQQHSDLLQLIKPMRSMIGISTYKNDLYAKELKDWNLYTFESTTQQGKATEYFYHNYPEPTSLHDYNFLGKDFTDRQRIKRKIQREISKLKSLPVLERQAIIESIARDIT